MIKSKGLFLFVRAFLCVAGCLSLIVNFAGVSAQTKRLRTVTTQNGGGGPVIIPTLTDSFTDSDNDGRAAAGEEITYTATIANTGSTDATNVNFTNTIDANAALVAGSVQVQPDSSYAIRSTPPAPAPAAAPASLLLSPRPTPISTLFSAEMAIM